jgi:hypothetical protein
VEVIGKSRSGKLTVQFGPASTGAKSSTLTIFDNAGNANQMIPLSGKRE